MKLKSKKPKIPIVLVSGSLVFDTIFELKSSITDQIVIEGNKAGKQNLMFTANKREIYFGGTAGNISYGLGLLNESSYVVSAIGKDFLDYAKHLKKNRGIFKGVNKDNEYTATFFGITDTKKEQIGIFQGGVYSRHVDSLSLNKYFKIEELKKITCAIFSPGTAKSISKQLSEFRRINKDAFTIFDPGQMLAIDFTENLLKKCLKNSDILIVNDTEANVLHNKFKFDLKKIFSLGLTYIIETKGGDGSVLYELINGEIIETKISAIKVKKVIDPTGAGDAFRAGIIYGIVNDLDIEKSMQLASRMGALCVKQNGGQSYKI